ncbi:hypothetical protein F8388_004663 [Cannabis sativa]|uniref:DUF4283 domain-containing protein n=1 Tax=Cannabis sativa TaxID=3483 RepID=A0A7J6I5D0_CANSA|nr:hypothetical protein F8388_004663 [Cannabis sativa]KAF4402218.1 hypothetical protein G4B88_017730 [Cannabis sativa]
MNEHYQAQSLRKQRGPGDNPPSTSRSCPSLVGRRRPSAILIRLGLVLSRRSLWSDWVIWFESSVCVVFWIRFGSWVRLVRRVLGLFGLFDFPFVWFVVSGSWGATGYRGWVQDWLVIMASSSVAMRDLEDRCVDTSIEGEDDGDLGVDFLVPDDQDGHDHHCIIGRFLTARPIDFEAMRHVMASLWQPGRGVYVKEIESNRYLFQFYHEIDLERVIEGSPWTFNRQQFIFRRLQRAEDPKKVVINILDMFCSKLFEMPIEEIVKPYGIFMRAQPRRRYNLVGSQWLRDGEESEVAFVGRSNSSSVALGGRSSARPTNGVVGVDRGLGRMARTESPGGFCIK